MKLAGKKALITGGNSGIGLATARLFISEGAELAITGRDQQTLDEAVAELGSKAHGYRADVTVAEDRTNFNGAFFTVNSAAPHINAVELMVDGGLTGAPFGAPVLRG